MNTLSGIALFSRTVENRFVFTLFDLVLCGVIGLVLIESWRRRSSATAGGRARRMFVACVALAASFAAGAALTGSLLFFGMHPAAAAVAWLDLTHLALLAVVAVVFIQGPPGGRRLASVAAGLAVGAALLHVATGSGPDGGRTMVLWNAEQFTTLLSLFVLAVSAGEAGEDLFDRVFVRLQIAFILLATVMTLVILQMEKTEYLASVRGRTDQLAEFTRAHLDYFRQRSEPLPVAVDREDFLNRLALGFGSLPELKRVRMRADGRVATFEIDGRGRIQRASVGGAPESSPASEADEYFLIQALPLASVDAGQVEFYGLREFLVRHLRTRIVIIFTLFTAMVGLSTVMIGFVVRDASATIRRQAREIDEAERRLMQASKLAAVGQLAGGVAHEINNPATTILSRASFLLSTDRAPDERDDLQAIVEQAQRIAQITGGLLTFSRPHALHLRPVPLREVVDHAIRSLERQLAAEQIEVRRQVPEDLPPISADADSLGRAFENLVRNALDAMPEGGRLEIRAETVTGGRDAHAPAAAIRVEVSDTGIGIPHVDVNRIFEPFFTTKDVGKGTGLGLAIVHGIIAEHHGSIAVDSRPGQGTRFTIMLPTEA